MRRLPARDDMAISGKSRLVLIAAALLLVGGAAALWNYDALARWLISSDRAARCNSPRYSAWTKPDAGAAG